MISKKLIKYYRLAKMLLHLSRIERTSEIHEISRVGVLVAISPKSKKFLKWHDGFTEAIKMLKDSYQINLIFFDPSNSSKLIEKINGNDFLIVKSGWRSPMDYFLRVHSKKISPHLGLMISASNHAPALKEQRFYDVVWYETEWYKNRAIKHPNAYHAFGIDKEIMKPADKEKVYDYIAVGAPRNYKRLHKLLSLKGRRLLIGDLHNRDKGSNSLLAKLQADGVEIEDFQSYDILASRYQQSKTCVIPCSVHGGGERSLLEARSCDIKIEIPEDNPKLKDLVDAPIWGASYYSKQLKKGIESVL